MHDNNTSDIQVWIDRIWKDADSHSIFANIVLKVKEIFVAEALQLMTMIIAIFLPGR